jgi:hypothetical protein
MSGLALDQRSIGRDTNRTNRNHGRVAALQPLFASCSPRARRGGIGGDARLARTHRLGERRVGAVAGHSRDARRSRRAARSRSAAPTAAGTRRCASRTNSARSSGFGIPFAHARPSRASATVVSSKRSIASAGPISTRTGSVWTCRPAGIRPARGDFEVDHHPLTVGLRRGQMKRDPLARQRVLDHLSCICHLSFFLAAPDRRLSRLLGTRMSPGLGLLEGGFGRGGGAGSRARNVARCEPRSAPSPHARHPTCGRWRQSGRARIACRVIRLEEARAQMATIDPASRLVRRRPPSGRGRPAARPPRRRAMTVPRRIALTPSVAALVSLPIASAAMARWRPSRSTDRAAS